MLLKDDGRRIVDGYEVVDLGLPSGTLWATCNIGANSETEYGNYYEWGKGASDYTITSGQSAYSGTEDPLAASANTAIQVMGSGWNKPTRRTMVNELTANTTYTWETNFNGSGVNGGKFTSTANTNAYVFFPASGYYNKGANEPRVVGSYSYFWTRNTTSEHYPYDFYMYTGGFKLTNHTRTIAIPVRGIHGAL